MQAGICYLLHLLYFGVRHRGLEADPEPSACIRALLVCGGLPEGVLNSLIPRLVGTSLYSSECIVATPSIHDCL